MIKSEFEGVPKEALILVGEKLDAVNNSPPVVGKD